MRRNGSSSNVFVGSVKACTLTQRPLRVLTVENIVSTTMYIVEIDAEKVEIFTRAMAEALDGEPFPPSASTMVGVRGLALDGMLVEISAVAALP